MTNTKDNNQTHRWHLIDLDGQTLGRVSTKIAGLLMGKQKPTYLPNLDEGDFVVAINAAKIKVTGKKLTDKSYYSHSGFPGGLSSITLGEQMKKDPTKVLMTSVKGMLPKNHLQDRRMARLKIFAGAEHPYAPELGLKKEVSNEGK